MTPIDTSVLDEVVAAVEPVDDALRAAAVTRLHERGGAGLGELERVAGALAAIKRTLTPPVERKVLIACAADYQGTGAEAVVRAVLSGRAPLAVLARGVGARVVVVDSGLRGAAAAELPGLVPLRVGDGAGAPGAAMTRAQALTALQTGIALVLSLASEGVDVLAACDLAPDAPAAAACLTQDDGDPVAALMRHGGLEIGALAGMCVAAAAIRVPVVVDGAGAAAAARIAARLAPAARDYLLGGFGPGAGVTREDGVAAPRGLQIIDTAARLLRELGPA